MLEVIDDVPAHISCLDLKRLCFNAFLPPWNLYTGNHVIDIDSVTLRDDKWASIIPRTPDVDAIAHKFYHAPKKNSSAPQFRPKKTVMHIHVPNRIMDAFNAAREAAKEAVSSSIAAIALSLTLK